MKPFLGQVAEAFYREYNRDIQNMAFVFPNRRAGIFFKKYLSDIIDGPIFSPIITTVSDLFIQLSELQPADHIYCSLFTATTPTYVRKKRVSMNLFHWEKPFSTTSTM